MIRVCVAGVTGWTGSAVAEAVDAADDLELVAGVSRSGPASFSSVAEALDGCKRVRLRDRGVGVVDEHVRSDTVERLGHRREARGTAS